jgi:hypothetical protein
MSRNSQESVVARGKDGVHHPHDITALEIGSGDMKLAVEANADMPVNRLDVVWDKLCEAAGWTC